MNPTKMSTPITSSVPEEIKLPFLPKMSIYDILSRPDGTNKRVPNAFIIYRMSLHRELVSKGYKISLPQLSTMASNAWKNELEEVKQAYKSLVNQAKVLYKEISLQGKNNTVIENAIYNNDFSNNANVGNNAMTGVNQSDNRSVLNNNTIVESSSLIPPENPLFLNSFDNFTTENNATGNNLLNERIRILEERQKLLAELLGIQFN